MTKIFSKLFVLAGFVSSVYSFAWGLTGHRVIAEIAENHLDCRARHQIKKLLGKERMAYWANWPDFIKSDTTNAYKNTFQWHYVNVDPQPDFDSFAKAVQTQQQPNLYNQIPLLAAKVKDKKLPLQERKTALIFLIHLMGDLSQPMHTGRAGDLGGNKIKVNFFGQPTNLHAVWDGKLIDSQKYSYTEYARLLDIKTRKERKAIQAGTLTDWLYDSHKIANKIYHQTPDGSDLGYDYEYKFDSTAERQLLYGGLRLAKMLNDIFS